MRKKITKRSIDELRQDAQAQAKTLYCFDSELTGFGAVATKTGACSYWIEYRLGGRGAPSRRTSIGRHGELTPDEARKKAKQELGKVANGVDVAQAKREANEKLNGQTLLDLIDRFLDKYAKPTRYWHQKRVRLRSDLKALHNKPVALIKRAEIAAVIDKVEVRSHATARLLHADLRPMFAWALDREIIEVNPIAGMKGPEPIEARDRVLTDEELCAFWQAASMEGWPFENIFKLLALTGQRREEVAAMRWRELDLGVATWTFAPEPIKNDDKNWRTRRTVKNGKAHTIDLHPEAVRLLDTTHCLGDFMFSTTGHSQVQGFTKAKRRLDERMQAVLGGKFQPWRVHDLRRTAATGMAALGFPRDAVGRVLNHVSGVSDGIDGIYQRHDYRKERKQAIMAWCDYVLRLVSGVHV